MEATNIETVLERLLDFLQGAGFDLVAIISALVAIAGALFSYRETQRQRKLQLASMRHALDADSLAWGNEAIDAMSEAGQLAIAKEKHLSDRDFRIARLTMMQRLSALVDRGRLLFPNIELDGDRSNKEGAYQGVRPPILDALMYTYYELHDLENGTGPSARDSFGYIMTCRRLLVSELQAHLDPKRRNEIVERFDHRKENQREEAMYRAGVLGLDLNTRRPGVLTRFKDDGFTLFAQDPKNKERFEEQ